MLSLRFHVKDKTKFCQKFNLVYHDKCPNENCSDDYIRETDRRIEESITDDKKLNKKPHLLKHAREMEPHHIWHEDFKITGNYYRSRFK